MITVYSTGCPKCNILLMKLKAKNINFNIVTDSNVMVEKGMHSAPGLQINDEPIMDFGAAIKWVNAQE